MALGKPQFAVFMKELRSAETSIAALENKMRKHERRGIHMRLR